MTTTPDNTAGGRPVALVTGPLNVKSKVSVVIRRSDGAPQDALN